MGAPWTISCHNRTSNDIAFSVPDPSIWRNQPIFYIAHSPVSILKSTQEDSYTIEMTGPEIYPYIWWSVTLGTLGNPLLYVRINLNVTSTDTWNWILGPNGTPPSNEFPGPPPSDWGQTYTAESLTMKIPGPAPQKVDISSMNQGSSLTLKLIFHDA